MDDKLRSQIYNNFQEKETDELLDLWQNGEPDAWAPQVFDIIEEILRQRLGKLPPQPVQRQVTQILRQIDTHLEKGELQTALGKCEQAIQMLPEHASAYNYRGKIHDELGQLEKALADYQMAIRLDPELEDTLENILSIERDLETEFHTSVANQHFELALEHFYEDELDQALAECELAKETLPNIAFAHNYLGMVLEQLGQVEVAIEAYLKAIQFNPRFYPARINLANARVRFELEQFQQIAHAESEADTNIEFDESRFDELIETNEPLPPWAYMDKKAFVLKGWPGYRTRQGRSGLDPLDTDFENAHMQGVIARKLLDRQFRTHNPFYLLFMTFVGLIYSSPLIGIIPALQGDGYALFLIIFNGLTVLAGLMILFNVWLSLVSIFSGEDVEQKTMFF